LNKKEDIDKIIGEVWHLKFWLVSDTHFWNKMSARDELWEFYDIAKSKWVEVFLHAGDLVDWDSVYTGQVYEQDKIWFDEQLKDVVDNYPDVWLDTYMIWGNHDEAFLKKTWGNIMWAVGQVRRDLINLWFYDARVKLNGVDINLHHWWGSMSYAKSYKIQKLLENIDPKNQPNVFASGHWHTALYMFYRKIHSFLPWAFLKENLLAKRFNLDNTIWGWVVEVDINETGGSKINMEFIKL
jgi:predicted phosphodiesterase